ncbi:MAG: alpha-glucosidase, partial [Arenibacter sp.]|nr:alpha-glucosidase [Arenibacter sp.]
MKKIVFTIGLILSLYNCSKPKQLEITSPNGLVKIVLDNQGEILKYNLFDNDTVLVLDSEISILQGLEVKITETKTKQVNETWKPVWGQFSEIIDQYNELEVSLDYEGIPAKLFIRTYNNGLAFRFTILEVPEITKPSFFMEYGLTHTSKLYSPAFEKEPIGPIEIGALAKMDTIKYAFKMPLLVENAQHKFLSLLESDLISAPGFDLIEFKFDTDRNKLVSENDFISDEKSLVTPWRIILFEDQIGDLLTNTVPLNVAAPNQIQNTSWIKPGKTLWDWRVHGYQAEDGFTYGIDNESYFRYIDFAAENNIEYFMIDDAWYTDVKPGYIQMSEKLDLDKVTGYAQEKGVSLLLYYDRRQGNYGDEALFPYYKSLDMKGV